MSRCFDGKKVWLDSASFEIREKVQKKLFELGYSWKNTKTALNDPDFILIMDDGTLYSMGMSEFSRRAKYYSDSPNESISYDEILNYRFKPVQVGDIVEITKSNMNWCSMMDIHIGKHYTVKRIDKDGQITFEENAGPHYWSQKQGHFRIVGNTDPFNQPKTVSVSNTYEKPLIERGSIVRLTKEFGRKYPALSHNVGECFEVTNSYLDNSIRIEVNGIEKGYKTTVFLYPGSFENVFNTPSIINKKDENNTKNEGSIAAEISRSIEQVSRTNPIRAVGVTSARNKIYIGSNNSYNQKGSSVSTV